MRLNRLSTKLKTICSRKTIDFLIIISLLAIGISIYGQGLWYEFVWDDYDFITEWQTLEEFPATTWELVKGDLPERHQGLYRPLRSFYYGLSYQMFGKSAVGYRIQAIVIHTLASLLVYLILSKLKVNKLVQFVSFGVFTIHPIHVEAIAWITPSFDIIGVIWALVSFWTYLHWYQSGKRVLFIASLAFASIAYFSNEITLVLPGIIFWHVFTFGNQKISAKNIISIFKIAILFLIPALIYLFIRFGLLNIGAREDYLFGSVLTTLLIMSVAFVKQLYLLVIPFPLTINHQLFPGIGALFYHEYYGYNLPTPPTLLNIRILFSIGVIGVIFGFINRYRKSYQVETFLAGWHIFAILPLMQVVPQSIIFGERYLYFASVGSIPLLVMLLEQILDKFQYPKRLKLVVFILIGFIYSIISFSRVQVWESNETLWQQTLDTGPRTSYALSNLSKVYNDRGEIEKATKLLEESATKYPNHMIAVSNLGYLYTQQYKYDKAIELHQRIYHLFPDYAPNVEKLAVAYLKQGNNDQSIQWYTKYRDLRPNEALAQFKLASAFQTAYVFDQAERQYLKAIELDSDFALSYWNLGLLYIELNRPEEAENMLQKAKQLNPQLPVETHLNRIMPIETDENSN